MATLSARLDAIRAGFEKKAPPEALETMHRSTAELHAAIQSSPGLGVGDALPAFSLTDQDGNLVHSTDLLARGPLLLVLFRGHW